MCGRVVSEDPFLIVYCLDIYKTKECVLKLLMIAALKLVSNWFVISNMIKKLYTALYADGNKYTLFNEDSGNVVFSSNEMSILNIDLSSINLDNNSAEGDPDIILNRLFTCIGILNLKNTENLKRDKLRINPNRVAS